MSERQTSRMPLACERGVAMITVILMGTALAVMATTTSVLACTRCRRTATKSAR